MRSQRSRREEWIDAGASILAGSLLLLLAATGLARYEGGAWSDGPVYLNDAILLLRRGRVATGFHPESALMLYGLTGLGWHSAGFPCLLAAVCAVFGVRVESVWIWNAVFYAAACGFLAREMFVRQDRRAAAILCAIALTIPSLWIYVHTVSLEVTLLGLSLISVVFWLRANDSASPFAILPYLASGAAAILLREGEIPRVAVGCLLWLFLAFPRGTGKNATAARKWLACAVAGLAGGWAVCLGIFSALNAHSPLPLATNVIARTFQDGDPAGHSLFAAATALAGRTAENLSIFFSSANDWSPQHTTLRFWFLALVAWGSWRLWSVNERLRNNDPAASLLALGLSSTLVAFFAVAALHQLGDYHGIRMTHAGALTLLLGLAASYLTPSAKKPGWSALGVLLLIGSLESVHGYGQWQANDPIRDDHAAILSTRDILVAAGAAFRGLSRGEQVLYYGFTGKDSIGINHGVGLQLALNEAMSTRKGPYYHLVYAGYAPGGLLPRKTQAEIISDLKAKGLCPAFAVIVPDQPESDRALSALSSNCGSYARIRSIQGWHFGTATGDRYAFPWNAELFSRFVAE